MNVTLFDPLIRWLGGLFALTILAIILYGVWRGTQRQAGRSTGRGASWLRSSLFYLLASAIFFGLAYLGWKALPVHLSASNRLWMLALGSLLYFPGLALVLWGRLALGKNYFVSTALGAQLFAGHQLVTSGPYAYLRHPMYTGLVLAAWGGLLIYFTWTMAYFALVAPLLSFRARREEAALAAEFGDQWQEYSRHTGKFIPRW